MMKQRKLVTALYRACLEHDAEKINKLRKKEFDKIFKHRAEGKPFNAKWTVVRI
jgi:hypothetical protein